MKIDRNAIKERYELLKAKLDERQRRLWAGAEATTLGHGGITAVSDATGIARSTIIKGRDEAGGWVATPSDLVRVRRRGAGPKRREERDRVQYNRADGGNEVFDRTLDVKVTTNRGGLGPLLRGVFHLGLTVPGCRHYIH